MVITDFLERNARLYGSEVALVEINPSDERDHAKNWREASLIETSTDAPYRRELTWRQFDKNANRFANLLLSRGVEKAARSSTVSIWRTWRCWCSAGSSSSGSTASPRL